MSKIKANGFNEVWTATGADSVKVSDFKHNGKAGLCYDCYGDSVALRGTVEIITDDAIRKEMWQDWFIHHFPEDQATLTMLFCILKVQRPHSGLTENLITLQFDLHENNNF